MAGRSVDGRFWEAAHGSRNARRHRRYSARRIGLAPLPPRSPIRGMLVHCASMPRHRTKRIRLKEYTMAETPPTPNVPKSAIKAEPYTPPPKPAPPRADKADQAEATKPARATAVRADQPVHRLMTVTITIDAESAEVVRVEGVDATGSRHELSDEEKASIMKERRDERLAVLVEQAFEAGIP